MIIAYVLIKTKPGKELEVIENLKKISEIKELFTVYGEYDVVVKVNTNLLEDLNSILLEKIRKCNDITSTTTLIKL